MVILQPFILYVTGLDGAINEMEVPSSDPQVQYTKMSIYTLVTIVQRMFIASAGVMDRF